MHELFHLLSTNAHAADGLMSADCAGGTTPSAATLREVRALLVPGQPLAAFPNQAVPPLPATASASQTASATATADLAAGAGATDLHVAAEIAQAVRTVAAGLPTR